MLISSIIRTSADICGSESGVTAEGAAAEWGTDSEAETFGVDDCPAFRDWSPVKEVSAPF